MPKHAHRLAFAAFVGTVAALLVYLEPIVSGEASDFGQVWFSAKALLQGRNPYDLIGPGREYPLDFVFFYPLTSSVAILPLGFLSESAATVVFVWISSALLGWAVTHDGWHRVPMFVSGAFLMAARRGQWSPLLTATYFLPWLGWALAAKPNIGFAIFAAARSVVTLKFAIAGGLVLALVAFAIVPTWLGDWVAATSQARHTQAPVLARGGFVILLVLLRWRRPEARLIVALACVPHSMYWYDILPLFLAASTFRESVVFALITTTGLALEQILIARSTDVMTLYADFNAVIVAVAYLPAVMMVLRRPNEGGLPSWRGKRKQVDQPAAAA